MDKGLRKFVIHQAASPFNDAKERQETYKNVFGTVEGQKVLQDILFEAGYFSAYYPNPKNPDNASQAIFNMGKREVCLDLLNTLTLHLKEYKKDDDVMVAGIAEYSDKPIYDY